MDKLLSCPFCDGKAVDNASAPLPYVYCESCDANGPTCDTLKGAFEHWNTRQALDALLKAERERALREEAEVCFAEKWKPKCSTDWVLARVKGHILALIEKGKADG